MASYLFRNISKFNIQNSLTFNNGKTSTIEYGSISPTNNTIVFGNQTWSIYEATQKKVHNDVIYIDDTPYEGYESRTNFNIFVNKHQTLLIGVGASKVINSFFKKLDSVCDDVDITIPNFDFDLIANRLASVKAVWMNTAHNPKVTTEALMGPGVMEDSRTKTAINSHRATYINVLIDIDDRQRVIGFSKKGAIILINPCQPMSTDERINLIYTTYKYVTTKTS
ncbi:MULTISPECIES: hypothetical protein [Lactiplantibacillus]|uniref:Uncharacterized protein n=1 Tax=Lactiplantibacillus argentoratensis TaxID=271881 RepID=A0ABS5UGM1_9LACO|nr:MULTISPECIES: hypothetical protein [Lactiplantibacillus]MBT1137667.1 hypothetical protein [Lactiplantibacillus argentoratensis]MBT1140525.1 hypothetical protein [Lactiplantibacillus argentoratensis]UWF30281.1 hypothetical protein NYR27_09565 [Lactiplantibacillus plantarum]UWF40279.1 hypothetical protein NYR28_05940 [Lactiplantibacillus plantarum]UWF43278.1 hypothetical protein NYR31_05950 [Lactiplantibacillus plantarum]